MRHTVLFPVPNPNRELVTDSWSGSNSWTKDFKWKGFTIFELKNVDVSDQPSAGSASESKPAVQPDKRSSGYAESSASSRDQTGLGFGLSSAGAPVFNVNINVNTTVTGGTTESRVVTSAAPIPDPIPESEQSGSSDFEFVSEDVK